MNQDGACTCSKSTAATQVGSSQFLCLKPLTLLPEMREMYIKTIKTLHLYSGAELILGYVQFIWALSPTSRSVWRKLTIRKLCIKVLLSFYTISFRKRHMESSVHSHFGNTSRHRPLSWQLPLLSTSELLHTLAIYVWRNEKLPLFYYRFYIFTGCQKRTLKTPRL